MPDPTKINPDGLRIIERPIASVVIISSDKKILMGRKDPFRGGVFPNSWHIPGGGIEDGETFEDAARRESLEEVGIDLTDEKLTLLPFVGHGESARILPSGEKVWCKMTFNRFEVRLSKSSKAISLHPSNDLVDLRWFSEDQLTTIEQVPGGKEFFVQAGYIKA